MIFVVFTLLYFVFFNFTNEQGSDIAKRLKISKFNFILYVGANLDLIILFLTQLPLLRLETDYLKSSQLRLLFVLVGFIEAQTFDDNC